MRSSQKPNRTRGRGNRKPSGNNLNRVYESSGPEGKVRGTPQQIIEKYLSLARDAQTSGNRVVAENFLQHAEHYQRILVEAMGTRAERTDHQQPGQTQPEGDISDDADTESDGNEAAASPRRPRRDEQAQGDSPGSRPDHRRANGPDDSPGGRRGARQNDNAAPSAPSAPRESEVSGLTMIDSGGSDADSLLVESEELSASQPRRRRRTPEPAQPDSAQRPAPAEAEAEPQPK